ncbi:hypothetical protein Tco_0020386 [Tanacetum coccineum]
MQLPRKTQKTLLKQQYENFSASSAESLDSIFNRLQKIVSRLAIFDVVIAQEDLNSKFLSSLPPEWNTHVVVWINKPEVKTMSIDDLYNNFKNCRTKGKEIVGQVCDSKMALHDCSKHYTASVSDNVVYAFMVKNSNGSNVLHQDLEQIHEDDLEAMDMKWQLSLLSCSSSSSVSGSNISTANFLVDSGNDADSSDDLVATQNKEEGLILDPKELGVELKKTWSQRVRQGKGGGEDHELK